MTTEESNHIKDDEAIAAKCIRLLNRNKNAKRAVTLFYDHNGDLQVEIKEKMKGEVVLHLDINTF